MNKGYQGASEMIRCVIPYKKPAHGVLNASQETFNKTLSAQRIIVENYFGRMLSLWNIMSSKYTWGEKLYDTIATVCVALTNFVVEKSPLRTDDGKWYTRYINRLVHIGDDKKRKRADAQAMYAARRKQRLREQYRTVTRDETEPED